ncbi:MAG TPA: serine/threonine-protein kinase, partial [Acidimicrobiales bacterium]|nr:serine/threonine-protein kinase [Acidimicrobiales bacterium]
MDPAVGVRVRARCTLVVTEDILRIANAIPDYDVERELGRGGMGIVFFGRHRRLLRGAAIKELPPSISVEEQVRERFATEAQTLAGLAHPHIVPIFDYVERDGECLIVMEELPGGSVWDRFTSEGLTPPTACAVVMAACAALQHAHDRGVLHLDMKPDNLMFDAQSAVKVTDFGISQVITGGRTMGTVDGQVLGTPAYMSPEQARGEQLTAASDVYAAGVMLYELLSGQLPWHGATTAAELLQQRLDEDPIPISVQAPHVPPAVADVVMRSIARDVDERYQGAEEFGVAIGEACARSWGPTWIDHAGVAIVGSEKLSLAARTTTHLGAGSAPADVAGTEVLDLTDPPARPAAAPPGAAVTGGGPVAAPATGAVSPAAHAAPATGAVTPAAPDIDGGDTAEPAPELEFDVIRASSADPRISGVDLYGLELADLVNVRDILSPPGTPWRPIVLAGVLFAGAALVGAIGLGGHDRAGSVEGGQVLLA